MMQRKWLTQLFLAADGRYVEELFALQVDEGEVAKWWAIEVTKWKETLCKNHQENSQNS